MVRNVFVVVHGPDDGKNEPKNYWKNCGIVFVNKDGSETVKLDLFPHVDIVIRDKEEKKDDGPDGEVREKPRKAHFRNSGYNGYAPR